MVPEADSLTAMEEQRPALELIELARRAMLTG
jgi:hypothetical protein